jgi:hypothetical protein
MDKRQKVIFLTLWFVLAVEWIGILVLIYFARLPFFISLFVSSIQLLLPWLVGLNIIFLLFTLFTKGLEFTLVFWIDAIKDFFKFFISSFLITVAVIAVSSLLGALLGIFVDRTSGLPLIKALRAWVDSLP